MYRNGTQYPPLGSRNDTSGGTVGGWAAHRGRYYDKRDGELRATIETAIFTYAGIGGLRALLHGIP